MSATSPVVLVLGAGANIGANVAKEFTAKGYRVVLTSRKIPEEQESSYLYVQGDLTQPKSVVDIFSQVQDLYGLPSVVVYNGNLNPRACIYSSLSTTMF
jgi:NAD(P)-dependent dehydrogenase (short-subunit alcohol dehydrogenase family)